MVRIAAVAVDDSTLLADEEDPAERITALLGLLELCDR
jgi:hypothetical protein